MIDWGMPPKKANAATCPRRTPRPLRPDKPEERRIAVRQTDAEMVEPGQLAADNPVRLAKIHLRVSGPLPQRNEHLAVAQPGAGHVIPNYRDAAGEAVLIAQPLAYPHRRMALLGMHRVVVRQYPVDDLGKPSQLAAVHPSVSPMQRWLRKDQHLVDRLAANPKYVAVRRRLMPSIITARRTF